MEYLDDSALHPFMILHTLCIIIPSCHWICINCAWVTGWPHTLLWRPPALAAGVAGCWSVCLWSATWVRANTHRLHPHTYKCFCVVCVQLCSVEVWVVCVTDWSHKVDHWHVGVTCPQMALSRVSNPVLRYPNVALLWVFMLPEMVLFMNDIVIIIYNVTIDINNCFLHVTTHAQYPFMHYVCELIMCTILYTQMCACRCLCMHACAHIHHILCY